MRRRAIISILISFILAMNLMTGCDGADAKDESAGENPDAEEASDKEKDAYDEYIKNALSSVSGNKPA